MTNLKVDFCGHKLVNPLIAGSCDYCQNIDQFRRAVSSGVGAVVMKSITDSAPLQGQSFTEYLCLNAELFPWKQGEMIEGFFSRGGGMLSEKDWLEIADEQIRLSRKHGVLLIGNICASIFENWARMAKMMVNKGISCLELNFGNPHFLASKKPLGAEISQSQNTLVEIVKSVRAAVDVPILVKVSPQLSDIVGIVNGSLDAGAEAVTVSHRFQGLIVDVETQTPLTSSWGGYGGHWQMPITMAYVARVAQATNAEICGSGGVTNGMDVIQLLMGGAITVQITTSLILKGFKLVQEILNDIESFCFRHGIENIEDIKGSALKSITEYAKLPKRPHVNVVKKDVCRLCTEKHCYSFCYFNAISICDDGFPEIEDTCSGCGLCLQKCPFNGTLSFANPPL